MVCGMLYAQTIPYNVNKKKFPLGDEFMKLLPIEVGKWSRFAFHDYLPDQENGTVYYQNENNKLFMLFGKAVSQDDMKSVWKKLYDNATDGKDKQVKQKEMVSPSLKYVLMQGNGVLFAWTRNLYYFCISTKEKSDLDDFMKSFPW